MPSDHADHNSAAPDLAIRLRLADPAVYAENIQCSHTQDSRDSRAKGPSDAVRGGRLAKLGAMPMIKRPTSQTYCIIGAGPSGIAVAKSLMARNINFEVFEREAYIGGSWLYGASSGRVYRSTHFITSKRLNAFLGAPMPDDYPDYPNHRLALAYLSSYATHNNLEPHIHFGVEVSSISLQSNGEWAVCLNTGEIRRFAGVISCTGHLWDPSYPKYAQQLFVPSIHSAFYRQPDDFRDKRVLVIGAGNSGCDIAVEACQIAAKTFLSSRRGFLCIPKYAFSLPIDMIEEALLSAHLPFPNTLVSVIDRMIYRALVGKIVQLKPGTGGGPWRTPATKRGDRLVFNDLLPHYLRHGDVLLTPDVLTFEGTSAKFADGSSETVDFVVFATGYKVSYPYIPQDLLNLCDGYPDMFLHIFHPNQANLFFVGLAHPDGGFWESASYQSELVAQYITARAANHPRIANFEHARQKHRGKPPIRRGGARVSSEDRLHVEHVRYNRKLEFLVNRLL